MKLSPNVIYLFFGRKAVLTMALFWQKVLSPPIFTKIIDLSLRILFGWDCKNISEAQKAIGYYHLYSCLSTKSLVVSISILQIFSFNKKKGERKTNDLLFSCL